MKNTSKNMTTKVTKSAAANTPTITLDAAIRAVVDTVVTNPTNATALTDAIRAACNAYAPTTSAADATTDSAIDARTILDLVTDKVHEQLAITLKTDLAINMAKAVIGTVVKDLRASTETAVDDLAAAFAHRSGFAGTYVADAILLSAFTVEEVKADTNDRIAAAEATLAQQAAGLAKAKETIKDETKLAEIAAKANADIKELERQIKRLEADLTRLADFDDPKAIAKIGFKVNQCGKRGAFLYDSDTDSTADTPTRLPRGVAGEEKPIWGFLKPGSGVAKNLKRGDKLDSLVKIEIKEAGKKARFLGLKGSK